MRLTGGVGGHLFGTLPLLSTFLEDPVVEPSPYAPASRLFWNELYLNIESIPELQFSQKARDLLADSAWRMERDRLVALQLVDHAGVWRLRLPVLDALVEAFPLTGPRALQLEAFVARRPRVRAYAAFRARMDHERATWPTWAMSNQAPDETSLLYRRYLLAQFWADEQVAEISTSCSKWGLRGLYLDLPLGVHSDSFDTWFYKDHFARGVSAGAPPDDFFTLGQDWGFPPLHPTRIRELGHEYLRDVLDFHSSSAALLRMDHVMGLFRLYWVPWGMGPKSGAYVRYPAEEMLALFTLASNQHQCALVGEDLGTVPPAVRPAMHAHGIDRLYVAQFSLHTQEPVLDMPPEDSLACINTHDLPPFAAFWLGRDIDDRHDLGLMDDSQLVADHLARKQLREAVARKLKLLVPVETGTTSDKAEEDQTLSIDPSMVLMGLIKILRGSANRGLLINLEDLWNAKDPQNVPGTWRERPNWQRKSAFDLESMANTVPIDRIVKWLEESHKEVL
jgi:4-alpha-glucanotransferase